ncbi:TRAP transporter large permease subunit [Cellvibrio sp. pealriver]|uniref:TRAP transporter large permease n=1 Tax=Cellvibrio sp. pealriver TaxID=1622269 RepID=UPI00066FE30A|nr:TRAP transporter large permease subunit [Cellvibrio sp. pealriver]
MLIELIPLFMFAAICIFLMFGYPVALTLGGVALVFAGAGIAGGVFDPNLLKSFPTRLYGIMNNYTLVAVPLFVFMGTVLEKSRLAEDLLENMSKACGRLPGGLGISVIAVGAMLAASTGIVGATVVTMGLMSLPLMIKRGYAPSFACGTICATGTLGQIIPPSIALVLLGDVLSSAYQQAQLKLGVFNPKTISVGDLFVAAIVPGLALVALYMLYVFFTAFFRPQIIPRTSIDQNAEKVPFIKILFSLLPVLLLIGLVLGSILIGAATPTEAAGVGALGACLLALGKKQLCIKRLREVSQSTIKITAMIFMILIGASLFSLVFRGFGGEELVHNFFSQLPGGVFTAVLLVMLVMFVLGFILDFIEIIFVVVPIVAPVLLAMGVDPIWLGIMIAVNLQTSFLTPPFGFALFYLRGVAPASIKTSEIYRGVVPFIALQLLLLCVMAIWPGIITWLPEQM